MNLMQLWGKFLVKLKHLGELIGIPFKQTEKATKCAEMFKRDEFELIERYCYEDVMYFP